MEKGPSHSEEYDALAGIRRGTPLGVVRKACGEALKVEKYLPGSTEYLRARERLDWYVGLPWEATSEKRSLREIEADLDRLLYGQLDAREKMMEQLAARMVNPESGSPVLCLFGPPGTGKATMARALAIALGRPMTHIRAEALESPKSLFGSDHPGQLAQALRRADTLDPVILIQNVNYANGAAIETLLDLLDPCQEEDFIDHFLEVPLDLSQVLFVFTTTLQEWELPHGFIGRTIPIRVDSYVEDEKIGLVRKFIFPEARESLRMEKCPIFTKAGVRFLIRGYTREAGVTRLESVVRDTLKKCLLRKLRGEPVPAKLDPAAIEDLLGPESELGLDAMRSEVGRVNGMSVSDAGGDLLPIEVVLVPGDGQVQLTGSLDQSITESASVAHTWLKSHADALGIPYERFAEVDMHLHLPEVAVPKGGPSAGLGIALAMASAFTGRRVRGGVAITGEITTAGEAFPVGGICEKLSAAAREGLKRVIIPAKNIPDLRWIRPSVVRKLDIQTVVSMDRVLELALR